MRSPPGPVGRDRRERGTAPPWWSCRALPPPQKMASCRRSRSWSRRARRQLCSAQVRYRRAVDPQVRIIQPPRTPKREPLVRTSNGTGRPACAAAHNDQLSADGTLGVFCGGSYGIDAFAHRLLEGRLRQRRSTGSVTDLVRLCGAHARHYLRRGLRARWVTAEGRPARCPSG